MPNAARLPILAGILAAACGADSSAPTPPPPPPSPPRAASLTILEGNGQSAAPSMVVDVAPVVQVKDRQGNPMAGVQVTFVVDAGGGSLKTAAVMTGSDGTASANAWRLGPLPGENRLLASADTVTPVAITANGRLLVPTTLVTGLIELPVGTGLIMGSLRVWSPITDVPVDDKGGFTAIAEPDGVQLASVQTAGSVPVLLAWLGPDNHTFNARSTAEVITYFDLGTYALKDGSERKTVRDHVAAANLSELEAAISDALKADAATVTLSTPAIQQARRVIHQRLVPAGAPAPRPGVLIDPQENTRSGVTVNQPGFQNLTFTNNFRRRVVAFVDRLSYRPKGGRDDVESVQRGDAIKLGAVLYVTSPVGAFGDIMSGERPTEPVISAPVGVPLFPADALATKYRVTVLGPAFTPGSREQVESLTPDQTAAWATASIETFVLEIYVPLFEQLIEMEFPQRVFKVDEFPDLVKKVVDLNPTPVLDAIRQGDGWKALEEIHKLFVDSETGQNLIFDALAGPLARRKGIGKGDFGGTSGGWIQSYRGVQKLLGIVEAGATGWAIANSINDMAHSNEIEQWDVTVSAANVALSPGSANINQLDVQLFKVSVTDATGGGDTPVFRYRWSTSGNFGKLCAALQNPPCATSFESSRDAVTYVPDVLKEGTDEIRVQVYHVVRGVEMGIGEAKGSITTWGAKVSISPEHVSIKTGGSTVFTARLDTQLQNAGPVTWVWSSQGRLGRLATETPGDAHGLYFAFDEEGTETVTAEAMVSGPDGARSLGSATATVRIEKGRPTVLSGGFEIRQWPLASGRECIVAFVTFPIVSGGKSYKVHAYGYHDPTGYWGNELTRTFSPPFPAFRPCGGNFDAVSGQDGGEYLFYLAGWAGPGNGAGDVRAAAENRFKGMTVDVTVTY